MPTTDLRTDEDLAQRAAAGCAASLDELLRRYQVPVLHFLRHRGHGAEAEDLLQETFVRAYRHLARYRTEWRFATWVFTIARRVSINAHRRAAPAGEAEFATLPCPRPGPHETAVAVEESRRLWSVAAAALSEEQFTAVWLFYVEDLPAREIARVLGRSPGSVKTMLCRARQRLLPRLGSFEAGGGTLQRDRAVVPSAFVPRDCRHA